MTTGHPATPHRPDSATSSAATTMPGTSDRAGAHGVKPADGATATGDGVGAAGAGLVPVGRNRSVLASPGPGSVPSARGCVGGSRGPALSVWATGQRPASAQRGERYVPETTRHPARMLPEVAAYAIEALTRPGDLVFDPMCGAGTTLIEALHLGRAAVGIDVEPEWASLARDNIDHTRRRGIGGDARVFTADARALPEAIPAPYRDEVTGRVALVLTSPPYGQFTHGLVRADPGAGVAKSDYRYAPQARGANLAYQSEHRMLASLTRILRGCATLLAPGGHVVITARPWREHGELIDLPTAIIRAATAAGLVPVQRCVALLAGLGPDGALVTRASFFHRMAVTRAREAGLPWHLVCHEDVLILKRAGISGSGRTERRRTPADRARGELTTGHRVAASATKTTTQVRAQPNLDQQEGQPIMATDTSSETASTAPVPDTAPAQGPGAGRRRGSWMSTVLARLTALALLTVNATTLTATVLAALMTTLLTTSTATAPPPAISTAVTAGLGESGARVAPVAMVTELPATATDLPRPADRDQQTCADDAGSWHDLTPAPNTAQGTPTVVRVGGVDIAVAVRVAARCACPDRDPARTHAAPSNYPTYPNYPSYPGSLSYPGYPNGPSSYPGPYPSYPPIGYPSGGYPGSYPQAPGGYPVGYPSANTEQNTTCHASTGQRPGGADWPSRTQRPDRGHRPARAQSYSERDGGGAGMRINVPGLGVVLDGW